MFRLKLRPKITITMIFVVIVPIALVTILLIQVNRGPLRIQAQYLRLAVADNVLQRVDSLISEGKTELIAVRNLLTQPAMNYPTFVSLAKAHVASTRLIHLVALYNDKGVLLTTLRAPRPGASKSLTTTPKRLSAGVMQIAKGSQDAVELGARIDGGGVVALPLIASAVMPEKKVRVYIWGVLSIQSLNKELEMISRRLFEGGQGRAYIIDEGYRIIAHGQPQNIGKPSLKQIRDAKWNLRLANPLGFESKISGDAHFVGVVPIPELGWGVVVEQRQSEAYRALRNTLNTGIGVGFGVLAFAILLGLVYGKRLAGPVVEMASAARRVAEGQFDTKVQITSGDEIGEMAHAFNSMASDLKNFKEQVIEETRMRTNLSRYLSPEVVEKVVKRQEQIKLGGERRHVTVIFADVVAFTPLAETNNPERIVAILNELFTFITEIVERHGGIVDKFIGDCVMAVFGTPTPLDDHAQRALRAAEDMLDWLEAGNAKWRREIGVELQIAIGVNSGEVIAGNIGTQRQMQYTVIGDAVNIASRLETMARPGQVLMTRDVVDLVGSEFEIEPLGKFNLVGRSAETEVFALRVE